MSPENRIRPESTVVRSDEPVAVEVDRTVVMMSVAQGMYFGLEGVGPRVWALLAQPRSAIELSSQLAGEFDVDSETCLRDVCEFLDELMEAQLIRYEKPADPARPPAGG